MVGDDDQALYRFRGATVEGFVNFEDRCEEKLGVRPLRIDLNINYRSRKKIVDTYSSFIGKCDWRSRSGNSKCYRIQNKNIVSFSRDEGDSVIFESGQKEDVAERIASLIKKLKNAGAIQDYNQCAILFSSLMANGEKNAIVKSYAAALADVGIPFYSPRANGILEQEEFKVVFGLFHKILNMGAENGAEDSTDDEVKALSERKSSFGDWVASADLMASDIMSKDLNLENFIISKRAEIEVHRKDFKILSKFCEDRKLDMQRFADPQALRLMSSAQGVSDGVKRALLGKGLNMFILRRNGERRPLSIKYVLSRVTAFDWTLLDLFYQLNMFEWFVSKYESVEQGGDDSALCNFGLITKHFRERKMGNAQEIQGRNPQWPLLCHRLQVDQRPQPLHLRAGGRDSQENLQGVHRGSRKHIHCIRI